MIRKSFSYFFRYFKRSWIYGKILTGKKVVVLVEIEYIPAEIKFYQEFFAKYGAKVDLMTYLWGKTESVIVSDVDNETKSLENLFSCS